MKRIALVGYMGAGKTSMAKILGNTLAITPVDTDFYIAIQNNKSINALFNEIGENGFREVEFNAIKNITERFEQCILSTGGGAFCQPQIQEYLCQHYHCVYLQWDKQYLIEKLCHKHGDRPLLEDRDDLPQYISQHFAQREPYYLKAQQTINCHDKKIMDIAREIISYQTQKS